MTMGSSSAGRLKHAWIATAASIVAAGVVAAVLLFGGDEEGVVPSAQESPTAPVSTTPRPEFAIAPWTAWHDTNANDWAWVRVFGAIVYVSTGPQYSCCDNFSNSPGKVVALDATNGKELWTFSTPSQPFPVAASQGRAMFGTAAGTVFAVDGATGKPVWQQSFPGIPFQVVAAGSGVVVADGDPEEWGLTGIADKTRLAGRVRGLDAATGEQRWEATVGNFTAFVAPTGDGVVAAASGNASQSDVAFLDKDGKELWRVTMGSVSSLPAVANGTVVLAGMNLEKLDLATGRRLWSVPPRNGGTFFGPSIQGDTVVVVTNTGTIESHSLAAGSLSGHGEFQDCGFLPLGNSPYGLVCGSLWRIDLGPQTVSLSPVLIPQGRFQSAVFAHGQLFYSSTIGSSEPTSVGHSIPGAR